MTKTELRTIENIIARLREPNLGCCHASAMQHRVDALNTRDSDSKLREGSDRQEVASRIYVDTWIIGALECLLPGDGRDTALAERMSRE